jgi:hypothetical protein
VKDYCHVIMQRGDLCGRLYLHNGRHRSRDALQRGQERRKKNYKPVQNPGASGKARLEIPPGKLPEAGRAAMGRYAAWLAKDGETLHTKILEKL